MRIGETFSDSCPQVSACKFSIISWVDSLDRNKLFFTGKQRSDWGDESSEQILQPPSVLLP